MRNAIFPPHLITVSVNMEHYASFPVIPACLAVPLLVYNLSNLPLAVIPVRDNASIGIHGAGNMTGIVIGVLLLPSLCSLSDVPAPRVHMVACPVLISILDSGNPASGIIHVYLSRPVCLLLYG